LEKGGAVVGRYFESDMEDLREDVAHAEAQASNARVKVETLEKQRDALLAACKKVKGLLQRMHEKRGYPAAARYRRSAQNVLTGIIAQVEGYPEDKGDQCPA
jgi:hypothetical protein